MRKRGLLLCLALLLVLCQGCTWPHKKTVTIGGQSVTIDPSVPENNLNASDFSQQEDGKVVYTGGKYLTGIDVSAHQGKINWKKVAKQVDFAMIQAGYRGYTEGKLAEDERFRENIQQALKYKLKVGVYFFSQAVTAKEAKAEAKYLLKLIKDYDITLNVAYDWEYIDNVDFGTAGRIRSKRTPSRSAPPPSARPLRTQAISQPSTAMGCWAISATTCPSSPAWMCGTPTTPTPARSLPIRFGCGSTATRASWTG